jgi:hypothetical protein
VQESASGVIYLRRGKKLVGAIILQVLFLLMVSNECNCSSAGAMVESGGVDRSIKSNDL